MSVSLHGSLNDFGIADVFQLVGRQRKTGFLDIRCSKNVVRFCFDDGLLIAAYPGTSEEACLGARLVRCELIASARLEQLESESRASAQSLGAVLEETKHVSPGVLQEVRDLLTQDTVFQALQWDSGSFSFHPGKTSDAMPPEKRLGTEQVLMDGYRKIDEWRSFAHELPDENCVFRRRGQLDACLAGVEGETTVRLAIAERVFRAMDGRMTTRRVIDRARLPVFEGRRGVWDLYCAGLLEPVSRSAEPADAFQKTQAAPIQKWGLAFMPLLLLALVVGIGFLDLRPSNRVEAVYSGVDAYGRAVFALDALRLRNDREAQHYLAGVATPDTPRAEDRGRVGY